MVNKLRFSNIFHQMDFIDAQKALHEALDELDTLTSEGVVPLRPEDRRNIRARLKQVATATEQIENIWLETISTMEGRVKSALLDSLLEEEDDT